MNKPLVIYHKGCCDGQGAAAAFYHKHQNAEFYPGVYSHEPPDVAGRDVYLVDFSYPLEVLKRMLAQVNSLTIIDHHKTAIEFLQDFEHPRLTKFLDTNHSGAVLTWMWCYPDTPVPDLLLYIEDRDLWRFQYPNTRAVNAFLYSMEFDLIGWLLWLNNGTLDQNLKAILEAGNALIRQDTQRVKSLLGNQRYLNIKGHVVPAVNTNHFHASDLGHELAKGHDFAATYFDTKDGRVFSLRSNPDGVDVSLVAQHFGGGGHRTAAGFKVSFDDARSFEIPT